MAKRIRTWRCPCGRIFEINGQPIHCSGKGHSVYISAKYWNYNVPKEEEQLFQLKLL